MSTFPEIKSYRELRKDHDKEIQEELNLDDNMID